MNKEKRAILIAILSELIFGLSFIFIRLISPKISIFTLLAWRNIIAFIVMSILIQIGVLAINLRGKNLKPVFIICLFQPILYYITETIGVRLTTASESGMILASCPIITLFFCVLILKEKIGKKRLFYMIIVALGVLLCTIMKGIEISWNLTGYLFLFFAMCCESLYAVLSEKTTIFSSTEKTYLMIISGMIIFSTCALYEHIMLNSVKEFFLLPFVDHNFLLCVSFLGIGCNIIGFLTGNYVLPIIGASQRAAFGGFGTIISIACGVAFLNEKFYWYELVATVLILLGAYKVTEETQRIKKEFSQKHKIN